ncbi:glutamine synthetase family protein [Aliisedimentitalea scapharcae]|uniref:Glutamine synthetase family protein n=1 Tax=Aliisedimentitalea scapharcae TaxID=1524259 RepID=A0ABZ2XV94_9RHOB
MKDDQASGALARMGLCSQHRLAAIDEVLSRLEQDGIETVRVLFADQHGILRGKTLVAGAMASTFANGMMVPSTLLLKDTSHRTAFPVWSEDAGVGGGMMQGASDVLLVPDPATFRTLPWTLHSAWVLCDVVYPDGRPVPFASRTILSRAVERLADQGLGATIGLEVEFHIFQRVDDACDHASSTMPGAPVQTRNLTQGYQFLTDARYGEAEAILDDLRRAAQGIGLAVRSVEIEMGPSQFEFTFEPSDPITQADAMVMFRSLVKQVCASQGLHASFMPKPKLENSAANGWHVHQSLRDLASGRNLFMPESGDELSVHASAWISGLLAHAQQASVLIAPTVNSYKRYQPFQLAPNRVQWGRDNRGTMLRALMDAGNPASRIENRAPDSAVNPHLAIAAQLIAGLDGVTKGWVAPAPTVTPYDDGADRLPSSLGAAIAAFDQSELFRTTLGDHCVDYLVQLKRFEWDRYLATVSEWEQAEYFNLL